MGDAEVCTQMVAVEMQRRDLIQESFIHSFIHLLNEYLVGAYYALCTFLGTRVHR